MKLEERKLGRLDLAVPIIGFGTAPISTLYQTISESQAIAAVTEALTLGIRLFDTAPLYGSTLSERRLGLALASVPHENVIISTKVGRLFSADGDAGTFTWDFSRGGVLRSLEGSLKRLKIDWVDLVYVHDPDHLPEDYAMVVREAFPALAELRAQGVVRGIGVGLNQWQLAAKFLRDIDLDVVLLAGRYTLLEQTALEFLNECQRCNIGVVLGGIFNSGILATGVVVGAKYNYVEAPTEIIDRIRQIEAICTTYAVPLAAVALQFVLAHPAVSSALLGMASAAEVQANWASLNQLIPDDLWRTLQKAGLIAQGAPLPKADLSHD